ncbi:MAG: hypothetical protein IPN95_02780 [Bacteroidetes bacterium]|nr:hypothetical protein [Bacteroidota bacterium]
MITTYSNVVAGSTVCISANGLPGNTFPNQIYAVVDNGSALQFDAGMGNIVIPQDYAELVLVTWTDVNGLTCNEDAPVPCPCSGNITSLSLTCVEPRIGAHWRTSPPLLLQGVPPTKR